MLPNISSFLLSIVEAGTETQTKRKTKSWLLMKDSLTVSLACHCCLCGFKAELADGTSQTINVSFLTGGVDEVSEDGEGAHPASLVTVLQLLKNKHDQPVWEGVG